MAFEQQSVYNKHQQSCDCEGDCNCGKKDNCGCCPPGLVSVTDKCGKNIGCLTPNDAAEYKIQQHIPEIGYVKLFHPTTGQYLGDVTPEYALQFIASIDNTVTPPQSVGEFNAGLSSYSVAMVAPADTLTSSIALAFSVDRISCDQGILIQFSGPAPAGVSFFGGATSLLIPEGSSVIMDGILIDDQVNAGSFDLQIAFSGCAQTKTVTLTVNVS